MLVMTKINRGPDLLENYEDMITLSDIFNHDIVKTDDEKYRWKPNGFICYAFKDAPFYEGSWRGGNKIMKGSISLNDLWDDVYKEPAPFNGLELMKMYMGQGYSLCGFEEIFGQRNSKGFFEDGKSDETMIAYVIRKYKGQVLRI